MSLETKEVHLSWPKAQGGHREEEVAAYAAFGWKLTKETVHRGRSAYNVFVRDRGIPHYYEVLELENKYFALVKKRKYVRPIVEDFEDFLLLALYFILLVLPFVLVLTFRIISRKRAIEYNQNLQAQLDQLTNKAKQLIRDKK